jgi:hypothetical protein
VTPVAELGNTEKVRLQPAATEELKDAVAQFLNSASIGAVKPGPQARIMLNHDNYNISDVINPSTGLRFIGTKVTRLVFKDRNGIFYVKSF